MQDIYRICAMCKTEFAISSYKIKYRNGIEIERYSNQKYCRRKCGERQNYLNHIEYYRTYWLTRSNLWKWKKELSCLLCAEKFTPNTFHQKYCLNPCNPKIAWKKNNRDKENAYARKRAKKRARENWHEKECKGCKQIFLPKLSNKNQQIYCSAKCSQKGHYKKAIESGKKRYTEKHTERKIERR